MDLSSAKVRLTGVEGYHNTGPSLIPTTGHLEMLFPRLFLDLHPKSFLWGTTTLRRPCSTRVHLSSSHHNPSRDARWTAETHTTPKMLPSPSIHGSQNNRLKKRTGGHRPLRTQSSYPLISRTPSTI